MVPVHRSGLVVLQHFSVFLASNNFLPCLAQILRDPKKRAAYDAVRLDPRSQRLGDFGTSTSYGADPWRKGGPAEAGADPFEEAFRRMWERAGGEECVRETVHSKLIIARSTLMGSFLFSGGVRCCNSHWV